MRKALALMAALALLLAGCGGAGPFDESIAVVVVSREDGSGTRSAFVELFEVEAGAPGGETVDATTSAAVVTSSTAVMINTVQDNPYAIGYSSLGSLSDAVKALEIDGAAPSVANIQNGSYKIFRPFLMVTKGDETAASADFMAYIRSAQGQAVVEKVGYVPLRDAPGYAGQMPAGKVVVAGSSSVAPVMEKLKEAYLALNPNAEVEIQQSDSATGLSAVASGIADIGMASRQLRDSELQQGLEAEVMAMDGIVVIVSHENPVDGLTSEQVRRVFAGEARTWREALG